MPLRAVSNIGNLHAFEHNAQSWTELKGRYRSLGLRTPCCGVSAIPKTSTLGNHFFAHARRGECVTAPETAEHLFCKQVVAKAAQRAGWTVTTERPGVSPSGEEWVADVFCEKGSARIAIEIQMSPQTDEEAARRQLRYKESGVRGVWFYGARARKGEVRFDQITPAFGLDQFNPGSTPTVRRFAVPLDDFVVAMLGKRLVWTVPQINRPLQIEYLRDTCWACQKDVLQVFGYFEGDACDDERFGFDVRAVTVASLSQHLQAITSVASNDDLRKLGLNPIGKQSVIQGKPTRWPHCNLCIHCRAPQNNFHLGEKLLAAMHGSANFSADGIGGDHDTPASISRFDIATIHRLAQGEGFWELKVDK